MAGNADPRPTTQEAPLGFSSPVMSSSLHDELRFPRVFVQSPHLSVVSPREQSAGPARGQLSPAPSAGWDLQTSLRGQGG